ncbi:hypothetical protein [Nocardioides sp.]|uniref:hypothetical protein n=1 Tax=Nocardioides sp. TaxID=35761 RepID=UPI0035154569
MTVTQRRGLAIAAVPFLLALGACGGGGEAAAQDSPTDASVEDYCAALLDNSPLDSDNPDADAVNAWADKVIEVGTPADISGDARDGFEIFFGYFSDVDDVNAVDDAENAADVFGEEDGTKVESYLTEGFSLCADQMMEDMPDMPDMPEMPEVTP